MGEGQEEQLPHNCSGAVQGGAYKVRAKLLFKIPKGGPALLWAWRDRSGMCSSHKEPDHVQQCVQGQASLEPGRHPRLAHLCAAQAAMDTMSRWRHTYPGTQALAAAQI